MRLLVSGGGTGGHVYPILSVVAALRESSATPSPATPTPAADLTTLHIRYLGTADGVEAELVARAGLAFTPIHAGQLRIFNPFKLARNSLRMVRGLLEARAIIRQWQPDVLFVTGGYVCAPVVWAAHRRHLPTLIYLPDLVPGLAVQRLARYADRIAVSFPEVADHFPGKDVVVTGYPVRPELVDARLDSRQARAFFRLQEDLPVLLVYGGSQGARSLNIAVAQILPELLQEAQVIHISGHRDWSVAQTRADALTPTRRSRYRLFPYLHDEMSLAFRAADLALTRAGAATLGELPAVGLPAVLVPLPISGGHQYPNARYLAKRGAAVVLENDQLSTKLLPTLLDLLHDPDRLRTMSQASRALARPDAAQAIASALLDLARVS
ncbi:MAG: undecaprenyldiphospho-muramoylpentapeptide beta-N-acetylglucosaminyltransferase [Caldilineae bacterium]|nr:MAG: undecaprenyldiphospho-muramoylpentapeptide beta-N-acetylglucosaminyltransferase [Caldilineae bacterium]